MRAVPREDSLRPLDRARAGGLIGLWVAGLLMGSGVIFHGSSVGAGSAATADPGPSDAPAKVVSPAHPSTTTKPAATRAGSAMAVKPMAAATRVPVAAGQGTAPSSASRPALAAKPSGPAPAAPRPLAAKAPAQATQSGITARAASASPGVVPVAAAGGTAGTSRTSAAASQDERVIYHYNALGRRDPFQALVGGGFLGMDVGGNAPPDIGGLKVVGIVWGASDQFALAEDARGNSLVLRKGDKVMNGIVESLKRDAVVVRLDLDGQSETVTIPVTRKGEQSNDSN